MVCGDFSVLLWSKLFTLDLGFGIGPNRTRRKGNKDNWGFIMIMRSAFVYQKLGSALDQIYTLFSLKPL